MADRLLRESEVAAMVGLGRTTRWEMERRGEFPRRRQISAHKVGWLESELLAWMQSRTAGGPAAPAAALAARGVDPDRA
jgi:prophage regulatory protein